jgi:hypothetical protein
MILRPAEIDSIVSSALVGLGFITSSRKRQTGNESQVRKVDRHDITRSSHIHIKSRTFILNNSFTHGSVLTVERNLGFRGKTIFQGKLTANDCVHFISQENVSLFLYTIFHPLLALYEIFKISL